MEETKGGSPPKPPAANGGDTLLMTEKAKKPGLLTAKQIIEASQPPTNKTNVAEMRTLNSRNVPKAFEKEKRVTTYPMPPKKVGTGAASRVPGVRPYPGELNVRVRGTPKGAVYAEDLEREERELQAQYMTPSYELSQEELLRHKDFLKLDQSKLPLEMFDNVEFADKDLSPQQWLATGSGGKSPYFHNGTWVWRTVEVLGHDAATHEYVVKFVPDGIEKKVRRLNLQFDKEDAVIFKERKRIAEEARDEAKRVLRLDHYVLQQPREEIQPIRQVNIRRIHERVVDGLPQSLPYPAQDTPLGNLLRTLTGDVILFYARTMKRTVLFARMEGSYRDERTVAHYNELKLPPVPPRAVVPECGKLPVPDFAFGERALRIESYHYSSQKEVLGVFRWLHDRWVHKFQHYSFVDFCDSVELPCSIKDFRGLQTDKNAASMRLLEKDFRRGFLDQLMDSIQEVYDFFQSNYNTYRTSPLFKLFRVIDLKLAVFLRTMFRSSMTAWEELVDRYTKIRQVTKDVSVSGSISVSRRPSLALQSKRQSASDLLKAKVSKAASLMTSERGPGTREDGLVPASAEFPTLALRNTEATFVLDPRTPLFQAELAINEGRLVLEPSVEDIQGVFIQSIDKMVAAFRSILSVDKEAMSLLTLEARVILNIGAGDPLYSDLDLAVKQMKTRINQKIAAAMKGPLQLCKMYNEFAWLLEEDLEDYLDNFVAGCENSTPTRVDFQEEFAKLATAKKQIQHLSFRHETFELARVDTADAHHSLMTRLEERHDGLGNLLATQAREQNIEIVGRYTAILERIAVKPANEKQLADLRDFIEESKETVKELQEIVADNRRSLAVLEVFRYPLTVEDMGLSWSTLEYPSKIEANGKEVEVTLEADKIRMMDRLSLQKEQFEKVVESLGQQVKVAKLLDDYSEREKMAEQVNALMDNINEAKVKGDDFNMREKVFGFAPTEYFILDRFSEELQPFFKLWNMVSDFHNSSNDWLNGDFKELDSAKIDEDVTEWWKTSYKLAKSLEEEFPGVASCAQHLRDETTEFRKNLPVIASLASKALQPWHWDLISELLGKQIETDELTLQSLLDIDAAGHIDQIQEVTIAAEKEYNLKRNMEVMLKEWDAIDFEVKPYKESGTFIVGGIDEIIAMLDDHIVKVQTMRGSPYIKRNEAECKHFEFRLKYAQSFLDEIITCQRTWMYLEPIFSSEDIIRQLPTEARRFQGVDALWRKTLADCAADPNFWTQADPEKKLEEKFKKANEKLEEITKGLNDYLEMKRLYFPRFFFLSNDELLEILSQTKEPRAVQPHLGKCFEGINKVKFEPDAKITEIISAEGEIVKMDKAVDPENGVNKGNVERWLLEIEAIQWDSIRTLTVHSLEEYAKLPRKVWLLNWPAQVILGVSCVYWTQEVTTALSTGGGRALADCNAKLDGQLREIVELVRGKLNKLQRKTLGALTTIDVHNRDVVAKMVDLGTREVGDFEWMSQLRYYWEDSWKDGQAVKAGMKTLVARIVNARCLYGYEYLGNTMRLVVTALTDRCYRTMIGAVDLLYGGAPEGPAGTGKTETVKDLSKAVAIHCVVFNCSDGLDYLAMAKFFKGLAGCGSWCCFDEFNRINIEVLSVIAQQILVINQGKREGKHMFHFEGTYMKLNHNCNAFITMNPGYAGRAELPDNLKALFRPCAMMVPDYAMIGEIRLYSFGFEAARINAQKIVYVLQLSSEQLSSQKHYDYGMRAVNSILVACGNLRQQLGDDPEWDEAKIVLRSINDVNLAKFLVEDLPLFRGITSDLFPGVVLPTANYGVLPDCLQATCDQGVEVAPGNVYVLENKPTFQMKTIQLYEMVLVRHGVMVVGQTCSGKTAAIHNLAKAMTKASAEGSESLQKVQIYTINPKSVTSGQLYGLFDENTHEFVDGILAVTFRNCAKDTSPDRKWLMFDGPVDAVWIENMNTVLDDNKKLCLNSGEIIKMSDPMTMFFEAEDLEQASPATVSRVGMIFCETRNIGWSAVRNIWLNTLSEHCAAPEVKPLIVELFDWLFPVMSYFVVKNCRMPTAMAAQELIFGHTRLLRCLLDFDDGVASDLPKAVEGCFYFSLIWSVGACVDGEGRRKFDAFLRHAMAGTMESTPEYEDFKIKNPEYEVDPARECKAPVPEGDDVYAYFFDGRQARWINWLEGRPTFKIPNDAKFNAIMVPTIDTIRHEWLLEKLLIKGYHVMCTGDTGTGKSLCIKNKLLSGMPEKFNSININFSAQTTANQTQDLIDSKLDKRRKGVLGPPLGMVTVVFLDDLNMPAKEEYGAQPPIEILRQWMDHQGWYDRKENEFRRLVDIQFCAAMGPPGGGRTRITQRYVRHFNVINFVNFSDESLARVFGTILDWRLSQGFASSVKQLSASAVQAAISIYNTIAAQLLPTPAKSHYTFNLRDLSKVFQGVLQGDPKLVEGKESFVKLWAHECLRVFHDRLIDDPDRNWFKELIATTVKDEFGMDFNKIRGESANLVYSNFGDPKSANKPYAELTDRLLLQRVMEEYLEDYNQMTTKPMNLVLFESAVEHIARISRIINQPYGNALLVGVGGSGRKSLTMMAVHIAEFQMFTIEITKSYGMADWREDIKAMMNKAGILNKPTVFMIDDTQIVKESFLEDINGILNTGEVANLFNAEETSQMMEALARPCQEAGVNAGSPAEVYNFFVGRVRTNLHLVICLSPIGEAFRTRLRMFPSLVNCCTIDWFTEWPEQALRSVANFFLARVDLDPKVKEGVVDVCVDMQTRVVALSKRFLSEMGRHYYVTPTSYLELISTFKNLLALQRQEVFDAKARYDNGLSKLLETAEQVNEMQIFLEDLQPKLKEATIETDALLVKISADKIVANEQSVIVGAEAAECNKIAEGANELKKSCEADLAEAIPALEAAEKALKSLRKEDIVEMKAMKKPSNAIKMTMAAICIMFGVAPDKKVKDGDPRIDPYWGPATKELLNDSKFLSRLVDFDRDNMAVATVKKATEFTDDPDFDPEMVAKKGSAAAAGLAKWVHAMVKYDKVAKVVAPKKAALKEAEATLKGAMDALAVKQAALKEVLDKVAALEAGLKEANDKKVALANQVIDCEAKLKRADALIKGLGGEKTRWTEMSHQLAETYDNVTGDIVLSAGVIAYLGAFISSYREDAIRQWSGLLKEKGITCSATFTLAATLGKPVEIRSWIINRLPNDAFSIENGIMLFRSNRWPLMIDPQGQANKWVKKMEEANSLKVVKQNQGNFVRILENAIQFGNPVLLENVPESLDPILESILLKQIVVAGGVSTIRLGDATIEYDKKFRLYITTKLRNPHYPPELCVKVNLLNFMATADGLQDQMLGRVVAMEQKELEAQRQQLILEDAENQRQLKEIEDKILFLLKNAEGNILDDEVLIDTLGDSKKTSNMIQEKVKIAETTQVRIAKVRQGYVPVAFQASQLFFCIADLAAVDPMYQYSLDWYITLYELSIEQADKAKNLEDRLRNLNDCFTYILYKNVCRSLFEKDKLLFSFMLTTKIMIGRNTLDPTELRFFLAGSTSMDAAEPNPYKGWLSDKAWNDILALCELPAFYGFKDAFKTHRVKWEEVINSNAPLELVHTLCGEDMDQFKKLCVLRCVRPDAVVPGVMQFIMHEMTEKFIEIPQFNMKECFADSRCYTPLIFVLTPGAAPMTELTKLAEEMGFGSKLLAISLGQGQGPIAERAIQDAGDKGTWVCLQNCHLCISWMPTLEKICEEFSEDTLHPNFRLWLTSEPSPSFPAFVLQNGVKMTNEPPKGMRANLLGSLANFDEGWFNSSLMQTEFKKMLFGLCFFHACVRERRKFGPLGWNVQYVFSPPDLRISMDQLRIFLDDLRPGDPIPYAALAYLVGECNYGGRVTDDKDRRCIMNILDDYYTPNILDDDYKFSPSGIYYAPSGEGTLEQFKEYVRALPYNEGPEVFGLHDNANISCALSETGLLLDTALSLQPRSAGGGGKSWAETLGELAVDIAHRMPAEFDIEKALILFPVRYDESMNTVLTQELIRFNRLINVVAATLKEIQKAIKGLVVLSAELEAMGNSMVIGKVPVLWSKVAYPSLKPLGSWTTDLLDRLTFLGDWMESGQSPVIYWISGFFFTQAFITGTLQNFARKNNIPIDKAGFDFRVLTPTECDVAKGGEKPDDGAYIRGLFMEGARWDADRHVIAESNPRELFIEMPLMQLWPRPKGDVPVIEGVPEQYTGSVSGTAHVYNCPLYKTSVRQGVLLTTGHSTNFVMFLRVPIPAEYDQKYFVKRGVAMLTQLDN